MDGRSSKRWTLWDQQRAELIACGVVMMAVTVWLIVGWFTE
jgi:hypothetical protein